MFRRTEEECADLRAQALASTIEKHKSGARSRKRNDGEVAERSPATKPADPVAKS
jgi:hypothetical protein